MPRILGVLVLLGLAAGVAPADVLIVKSGRKKVKIHGLPAEMGETAITQSNWRIYLPKSTGVILEENYDSIVWKKSAKAKDSSAKAFPMAEVVAVGLAPLQRDSALDQGYGALANGDRANALRSFSQVLKSETARTVDRAEADFQIGFTHLSGGRIKSAQKHFEAWNRGKSKFTPEVYRLLGEIYTAGQKYKKARATYGKISGLADIPQTWKYKARCGLVKVDIAERKYDEATKAAAMIAAEAATNGPRYSDNQGFALGLQAQAIIFAQNEEKYPEADALVRKALGLKDLTTTTKAFLNVTLGDSLYAQRKLDEARYPYMRVAELYTEERGFVGVALFNAGNCFIDMSSAERIAGNDAKADELLIKGMKLIIEAGKRYGNSGARKVWRKHRAAYEAAQKK
ncbi:MAG: tetratricopeptide repeat protein [Planctomycetota bacterium]